MKKNRICVISGPTASGKTQTSLNLAKKRGDCEIVNFDSLLFYAELNIGTAKPSKEEMAICPHHMVDIRSAKDPMNAADYEKAAKEVILDIHSRDNTAIVVGGSGFYLQALLYGMFSSSNVDEKTRERSDKLYQEKGIEAFIDILRENDPGSFERYHENDHYRLRRAVEHFWTTGTKFSEERVKMMGSREENSNIKAYDWNVFHAYLDLPKDDHFDIIQKRTSKMIKDGLLEEVNALLNSGFTGEEKPLMSIGYKEAISHIRGDMNLEEMEERINISTRQLAKSQRTWFKKIEKSEYNPLTNADKIAGDFESFLKRI